MFFKNLINWKIEEKTLSHLLNKIKNKGKDVKHAYLGMQKYLSPNEYKIKVEEAQQIFKCRANMVEVKDNFKNTKMI